MSDITDDTQATAHYASRKFLLALLVVVAAIAMRALDLIDVGALVDLLKWTLGLYFGANVGQKAADWFSAAITEKNAPRA